MLNSFVVNFDNFCKNTRLRLTDATTSAADVYKSCSDSSDADDAADNQDGGNRKKRKKTGSNTNSTSSDLNVVHELRAEIDRQRDMISALTSRLNFILSKFGIDELSTCCKRQESSYSQQVQQTVSQSVAMAGGSTSESAAASVTASEAAHSSVKSLSPAASFASCVLLIILF